MLLAGKMRTRVQLEKPIGTVKDAFGQIKTRWEPVATRWAEMAPQAGREYFLAAQVHAEMTHLLKLRNVAGADASWSLTLVKDPARRLQIISIVNMDERGAEYQLVCKETT